MTVGYRPYPVDLVGELDDLLHIRETKATQESQAFRDVNNLRISQVSEQLSRYREPVAGDVVVGARLDSELGAGEFGRVWRATRGDGSTCAVKVFHPHRLTHGRMVREFRQGVAAMRLLSKEGLPESIVHLFDADDAQLSFSMTLVEGKDLQNIRERGWTLEKKVLVFSELCCAVKFAHEHKVIHRDIKPANVVIGPNERPVLTDFDLADLLTLGTLTNRTAGTLAYAAPEQVEQGPSTNGKRRLVESDIYSLGRLLRFLVTHHDPGILDRDGELSDLTAHEGIRRIVRRCTMTDPSLRYVSADELLVDLAKHATQPDRVGCALDARPSEHPVKYVEPQSTKGASGPRSFLRDHQAVATIIAGCLGAAATIYVAFYKPGEPPKTSSQGSTSVRSSPALSSPPAQVASALPSATAVASVSAVDAAPLAGHSAAARLRISAWMTRGIGKHSPDAGPLLLHEGRSALESDEMQIGSFVCRMAFNDRGDPLRASNCQGIGAARTSAPLDLPLRCNQSDDRTGVNCWSDHFAYSVNSEARDGQASLTLGLR